MRLFDRLMESYDDLENSVQSADDDSSVLAALDETNVLFDAAITSMPRVEMEALLSRLTACLAAMGGVDEPYTT